jgi:outer membrane protein assembly factor BamB
MTTRIRTARRWWVVIGLTAVILLAYVGWRGRHRVREFFRRQEEQQKQTSLEILSPSNQPRSTAASVQVTKNDWPFWRGFDGSNSTPDESIPVRWTETENVRWKTEIPGRGHSSPCVLNGRIYLTTALAEQKTQQLICADLQAGKVLWVQDVHRGEFIHSNPQNSHASSTAVTDGTAVFTVFAVNGHIWLSSFTPNGSKNWQCQVGPYVSKEGFGASPVIVGALVIVAADNVNLSWIAGIDRQSGGIRWRRPRGIGTSYGSPALVTQNDRPVIVMAGLDRVAGISIDTGDELWNLPGPDLSASTPVFGDELLFVTGCAASSGIYAFRMGESPEPLWNHKIKAEVPSPLYHAGRVTIAQDNGILNCYDAVSGKQLWRHRVGGNLWASPIRCGDNIYVTSDTGKTVVMKSGPVYEEVAVNTLECEGIFATPVPVQGQLLVRSLSHLYCIGNSDASPVAPETGAR